MFQSDLSNARMDESMTLDQMIIDAAPDGIMLVAQDGTILMANPAMEPITGYNPRDLVGESMAIFLPPGMREHHAQLMAGFFPRPATAAPWAWSATCA